MVNKLLDDKVLAVEAGNVKAGVAMAGDRIHFNAQLQQQLDNCDLTTGTRRVQGCEHLRTNGFKNS